MWEIAVSLQAEAFLWSVALGAALCLIYDIQRAFRRAVKYANAVIAAGDILYFSAAAVLSFLFLLVFCCGQIRGFVLLGEAVGFAACRLTLSRLWMKILLRLSAALCSAIRALWRAIMRFEDFFNAKTDEISDFLKKSCKKTEKSEKNS